MDAWQTPGGRRHGEGAERMSGAALAAGCKGELRLHRLGRMPFEEAMRIQEELLAARIAGAEAGGDILLVEHDAVYTLGRGGDENDLLDAPRRFAVPVVRTGRGGGATFHGPGQVVAYPIVPLPAHRRDVRRYVHLLEQALIETCAHFSVTARRRRGQIGVFAEPGKVAAVGIGVRRGVAFHGVAINVCNDLDYFAGIVPCRCNGMAVTSLGELVTPVPSIDAVGAVLVGAIAGQLGMAVGSTER